MPLEISHTQEKRVAKVERLREYFKTDRAEMYEWTTADEALDFSIMSDPEIEAYLNRAKT